MNDVILLLENLISSFISWVNNIFGFMNKLFQDMDNMFIIIILLVLAKFTTLDVDIKAKN